MASSDSILGPRLLTMKIIALALPMGVVIFLGVVALLALGGQPAPRANEPVPTISIIAVVWLAVVTGPAIMVPNLMTNGKLAEIARGDGSNDLVKLLEVKQTAMIVRFALFEGAAFLGCIALFLERQLWALAVPAAALTVMFLNFPTENSVRQWLEVHARRVLELRDH